MEAHQGSASFNGSAQQTAPVVFVNHIRCAMLAPFVLELMRKPATPDSFSLSAWPPERQTAALCYLVAICNQLNWDFVLGPLALSLSAETGGLDANGVLELSDAAFRQAFNGYRRKDEGLQYKSRLTHLKQLAEFFRSTDCVRELWSTHRVASDDGALAYLSHWPVYQDDPLQKKANALLHELVRRRLIDVVDPENLEPAVDYHLLRFYLRTGRIVVTDRDLEERLIARTRVRIEVITELRRAVAEAMCYTAWLCSRALSDVNHAEWAFARRACRRDEVWCARSECPIADMCPSSQRAVSAMLTEPTSRHGHY